MLGKNKAPTHVMPDYEAEDRARAAAQEALETDARNMEPELRAEQGNQLVLFQRENETDRALYTFRCERYGDFLALFVGRGGTSKAVSAISLGQSREIRLEPGHPADLHGTITFYRGHGAGGPKVVARKPDVFGRSLLQDGIGGPVQSLDGLAWDDRHIDFRLEHCAQPARDDRIVFTGAKITLYAPHGLGEQIFQTILGAIRDGER